ncbi:MAG: hypothetical protein HY660_02990, partial [Armatimonadetes bacterium]|nr:hypothetical protein [Armatimonadota bacterium]
MAVPSGSRIAASVLLPPALPIVTWPCPPPYDLRRTLESGQAFRWRWDGDAAVCVVAGRVSRVRQEGSVLRAETADPAALRRFLVVDAPLREIETALARDPVLRRVLPHTSGIAILRQEPWECLVSYIISAFNNIPKIQQTIERLSRRFGRRLAGGAWVFPTPPRL